MSGPAELAIAAGILADAGLKATLLVALGSGVTRCLGSASAAQRHAVWVAVFAVLPLLPVVSWMRGPTLALDVPFLVAIWAVGALAATLPILGGLVGLTRIREGAHPDAAWADVRHSEGVDSPITWGVWRPVIVLPTSAAQWSQGAREAALAHERAHIARRDWLVHMAVWGVCAMFWFHPLVWWARRAVAQEAEHAADDLVLAAGVRPSDYAELLLSLARPTTPLVALGAASSLVGDRVRAVLDRRSRSARRWPAGAFALALSAASVASFGGWSAWSTPETALTCQPGLLP